MFYSSTVYQCNMVQLCENLRIPAETYYIVVNNYNFATQHFCSSYFFGFSSTYTLCLPVLAPCTIWLYIVHATDSMYIIKYVWLEWCWYTLLHSIYILPPLHYSPINPVTNVVIFITESVQNHTMQSGLISIHKRGNLTDHPVLEE